MRIIDIAFLLNPKMKQVHLKLLLCLLLAITTTGQYNGYGQNGARADPQPFAMGQSSMERWGGFSGPGAFGPYGQRAAVTPIANAGYGYAPTAPVETRMVDTVSVPVPVKYSDSYGSAPAIVESRRISTNVCYNIIDSVFPSFSSYCSVLPQTTYTLPNFFGHQTKYDVNRLLNAFSSALDSQCFSHIRMFTCPLLFPPCDTEAILPCAGFCRAILSRCGNFELSAIDCDRLPESSEFCPTITIITRSIDTVSSYGNNRGIPAVGYGEKSTSSSGYSDTSLLTRSSGTYSDNSDVRTSSTYGSSGGDYQQRQARPNGYSQGRSAGDLLSSSFSATAFAPPVPDIVPTNDVFSRTNGASAQNDISFNSGSYSPSGYGNSNEVRTSPTYGGSVRNFKQKQSVSGTYYGGTNTDDSVDCTTTSRQVPQVEFSSFSTSKFNNFRPFNQDWTVGDKLSSLISGGDLTSVGYKMSPSGGYGGSSIGNAGRSAGSSSYGSGAGYGGSSTGNAGRSAGSTSYGSGAGYGGSSIGNAGRSAGSSSYGSGAGYGGASFSKNSGFSSFVIPSPIGSPYGIQSTGEYAGLFQEQLDLSKCGPLTAANPCTPDGPQYFPFPGSPHCYIQCAFDYMFIKPCPSFLIWNPNIDVCVWPPVAEYAMDADYFRSAPIGSTNLGYGSGPTYSYGRKKRSTTERKKRYSSSYSSPRRRPSMISLEAPLGPPLPGILPLPGFPGPIGVPGPLLPPFFPGFLPPMIPPIAPLPPPILPPPLPAPILPAPLPPPILPPPILPPPIFPPIPPPGIVPPFLPPFFPPLPIPLGGPLLPPLPMSIPATFIPGPPPIFGSPFFGGFGGPFVGGLADPFFGFGGGFPFDPMFDSGYDSYSDGGDGYSKGGYSKGGYSKGDYGKGDYGKGDYGKGDYGKGGYSNDYDDDYDSGYGKSYSSSSYGDDDGYSKSSDYSRNGNFKSYKSKGSKYSSKKSKSYDSGYSDNSYRKKRQYGLNVDQDASFQIKNVQRTLPKQYQTDYNPMQLPSYGLSNQQQSRVFSGIFPQQQLKLRNEPSQKLSNELSPCVGKPPKSNVLHPTDEKKYISCINEEKYQIMDCPSGLIYNAAIDQCEKLKNTESICEQEKPCLNDGQCYQTSPTSYKCTCRGSWTGEHCETPLSSCSKDPCGQDNECHTLTANDYKQDYVCVCDGRKSYGLSCGRNTVPNPCMTASNDREQYYPFAFSAHAYVQCNGDLLYVRPCAGGLYWNQETKICDREETSPARPADDQPQSYDVNYNSQQTNIFYNRPLASFNDQSVDRQQGYRYRNYNPHALSNDQSSISNQIHSRKDILLDDIPLSTTNQGNVLYQQKQMTPFNRFSSTEQRQPIIPGQSFDQRTRNLIDQPTPSKNIFRVSKVPLRSTASSYRR